ncbi:MAG: MazG nucleotide pyrophosphohydrolase domain-containing protein [Candidatus Paceibacterota bacterium]|jgi:NTP pyrophosphatase (non-canonical NTP hydrolase)
MTLKELDIFIKAEDIRLQTMHGNYEDEEKRLLARTVKLSEEVGELSEMILSHCSFQRKEKLEALNKAQISGEFADVIIVCALLANTMKVDLEDAIEKKIKVIEERHKKHLETMV